MGGLKKGKVIKTGESCLAERHDKKELVLYGFAKKWLAYDLEVQEKMKLSVKRLFKLGEKKISCNKNSWLEAGAKQIQTRYKAQFHSSNGI